MKLFGYFQSPKYFEPHYKSICKLLQIDQKKTDVQNKSGIILSKNTFISMHFRIGDYKTIEDAHPILKLDYYKNSIKYMLENNNTIKYILCFGQEKDELELLNNGETIVITDDLNLFRAFLNLDRY